MTVHTSQLIRIRQIFSIFLISLLIVFGSPAAAWAEEVPATTTDTTATAPTSTDPATTSTATDPAPTTSTEPVAPTTDTTSTAAPTTDPIQGPTSPTGADSTTYTYNEATGLWENDTYTWDPVTKQTAPKQEQSYSYNPATGQWDTTEWVYDAPSGTYIPNTVSVATPPEGAALDTSAGAPAGSSSDPTSTTTKTLSPSSTSLTSPNSSTSQPPKSTGLFDLFYNAAISNTLTSLAQSGDATVALNTLAGNALSGSASAIATVINLLQSSWNLLAGSFTTFTQNLFGNFIGDLTLDPGSTQNTQTTLPDNLAVNSDANAAINNKITLEANSGNATVSQNTEAGNATSGDATAIANLINAINSSIAAGQSFVGMLNIFGSLDGDILIPPELTQTLLAANAVGTLDTSKIENSSILGTFTNNQSITNNVSLDASSGGAAVSNNTSAGSATTGDASTNLTVLNLTGRQVIGKDALLVFVNVLGNWVGMIVNAPTGTTSAALGGGITGNSDLAMNTTSNQAITNDISVGAHSGDALVDSNTKAGNATSGDAKAAVNLVNISGSQFSLSDWFGILFINVFGTWKGSFGINTIAGTIPLIPTQSTTATAANTPTVSAVQAFRFAPTTSGGYSLENVDVNPEVLAAVTTDAHSSNSVAPTVSKTHFDPPLIPKSQDWTLSIMGVIVAGSLLGTERLLSRRNRMAIH